MRNFNHSIADALFRRITSFVTGVAVLLIVPLLAEGADLLHVRWEGLSIVAGKTVMVAMPEGPLITGKVTGVEPDGLVVKVTKTTDQKICPKGELRVPRATLHVFQMRTDGKVFHVLLTLVGAGAGFTAGGLAAMAIDWHGNNDAAVWAAVIGGGTAGTVAGFMAGRAADRRWTTVEILP